METLSFIVNASSIRRQRLGDKEYVVAPMVMLKEGVLAGNRGAAFYPADEIEESTQRWEGMPLVANHPKKGGKFLTANDPNSPEVYEEWGIGFVQSPVFETNTLRAEAWFDVEKANEINPRILIDVNKGQRINVSTGLHLDSEQVASGLTFNGKPYKKIVSNFRPDHLAILLDENGACSLEDGCGLNVNKKHKDCSCDGKSQCGCRQEPQFHLTTNVDGMSHSELHEELRNQLQAKFTQADPRAWIHEVYDDYVIYWQEDQLYKLGYSSTGGSVALDSGTPQKVRKEVNFVTTNGENPEQEEKSMSKKELIDKIIANSETWEEEDRTKLDAFDESKLKIFLANSEGSGDENKEGKEDNKEDSSSTEEASTESPKGDEEGNPEGKDSPVTNQITKEQIFAAIPGLEKSLAISEAIIDREKESLVANILSASGQEDNEEAKKLLVNKSIEDLELMKSLTLPSQKQSNTSFIGRAGGRAPVVNSGAKAEPLMTADWDWNEVAKQEN